MMEAFIKLQSALKLKPEKATAIARAYDIDQVKTDFLQRYHPSRDGCDPIIAFAKEVIEKKEYRDECNQSLSFAEEIKIPDY
jgi:hypothetical protein